MDWISVNDQLPKYGQLCDIWITALREKERSQRLIDHVFVRNVGVTKGPAFQDKGFNDCGLYEGAFLLSEGYVTHWRPSPLPPAQ